MFKYVLLTLSLLAAWATCRDIRRGKADSMPTPFFTFYRSERPVAFWGVVAANGMMAMLFLALGAGFF
jgi:hypothetical protein